MTVPPMASRAPVALEALRDRPRRAAAIAAVLLLVALAVARGTLVALVVPPLQAPDEDAHFDTTQFVAETGRLPPGGWCDTVSPELDALGALTVHLAFHPERSLPTPRALRLPASTRAARATPGCGPASAYPPLYYATAAAAYRAAYSRPLLERLFAMRLVSVAWGCAGALAAFLFGVLAFRRTADGLLLGMLWVAQPQVGLLTGTVNNDAAFLTLSAACAAAVAMLARSPRRGAAVAALSLLAAAGAWSKPTFLGLVPALLIATAVTLGARRPRSWIVAAIALAPAAVIVWLWRGAAPTPSPGDLGTFVRTLVLDRVRLESLWVKMYWMTWGWADTVLRIPWYRLIEVLLLGAVAGLAVRWRHLDDPERWIVKGAALATLVHLGVLYAVEYRSGAPVLQGRYLLPVFVPHAAALVVGLRALARSVGARLDPAWALALVLLALEGAAIARAIVRYHA